MTSKKTNMFKLIVCIKRNPKMSHEEFRKYWLEKHGPLFCKFAKTYKAVRYVQNHTVNTSVNNSFRKSRGYTADIYDGIGEICWESEQDFIAAVNSPECQKLREMFIEDEAVFIDHKASSGFFTIEHILFEEKNN